MLWKYLCRLLFTTWDPPTTASLSTCLRDPCFALQNKAKHTHKPQTNSSLQPAKTKSRVSARRQILPTEHSRGSADPEPPELSLNCATNRLSCCRYLPEVTPSVGTLWQALPISQHTPQEHSVFPNEHSWKASVSPQVLHAPVASVCPARAATLELKRARWFSVSTATS